MNAEYNPLAPFFKGDFVKSPLKKGDSGGCLCQKPIFLNCYSFLLSLTDKTDEDVLRTIGNFHKLNPNEI